MPTQLDQLAETHAVVPLSDLLTFRSSNRPIAVITFDDAYEGAVTVGLEELSKRGLPATIFVAPAYIGASSFWWDAVVARGEQKLTDSLRTDLLQRLQGKEARIRAWAHAEGLQLRQVPAHQRPASEELLKAVAAQHLVTLGSHTWSHPNLARLEEEELVQELTRPLQWLRERFQRVVAWLSYPYGARSAAVEKAAQSTAHDGALLIDGGWISGSRQDHRYALPRLNIPAGLSLRGFEMRAAGLLQR